MQHKNEAKLEPAKCEGKLLKRSRLRLTKMRSKLGLVEVGLGWSLTNQSQVPLCCQLSRQARAQTNKPELRSKLLRGLRDQASRA